MMKLAVIIFYFSLICFVGCVNYNRQVGKYNFLLLTQSWPLTSYWKYQGKWTITECNISSEACAVLEENKWVVHGLWPQRDSGKSPSFCHVNLTSYNSSIIDKSLKSRLKQKMLTYSPNLTEDTYWQMQWEKHGTCVTDLEVFSNMTKYFSKTLDIFDQYDVGKILKNASIVSGKKSYKLETLIRAITAQLKIKPIIKCAINQHNKEGEQYLFEIHLCFNKQLELQNCSPRHNHTCQNEKIIYYPKWNLTYNAENYYLNVLFGNNT